mmetsp:Transcript_14064/g.35523  ORF Transcript_14064/g.35523 Transcript_14064/m.35523 type:complete len:135 (-) Transcript_14064:601-1005(-)
MGERKQNADDINDIYESFGQSQMLFVSDVENILSTTLEDRKKEEPNYEFPNVVEKAHTYAKRFSTFTSASEPSYVKDTLSKNGLRPHEIVMLGNLCPDNLDEALHLIPTLKTHIGEDTEKIDNALNEIHKFCRQ